MSSSSTSDSEDGTSPKEFEDFDFFDSENETKKCKESPLTTKLTTDKERKATTQKGTSSGTNRVISTATNKNQKDRLTIHMPKEESFSESDDSSGSSVTDVSPLQSPEASPRPKSSLRAANRSHKRAVPKVNGYKLSSPSIEDWPRARRSKGETLSISDLMYASESGSISSSDKDKNDKKRKKFYRKKKVDINTLHHRMEASTRHHRRRLLDVAAQNSMDISQLLEVVLEMEQEENRRKALSVPDNPKYFCHMQPPRKKNMSFSKERVRDIDMENERLLNRLTHLCSKPKRPSSASSMRSTTSSCQTSFTVRGSRRPVTAMGTRASSGQGPRLYHSATNRIRDQQRIERENIALLKRLQGTRASRTLRRTTLLHDYERQTGKPVGVTRPPRQRNTRSTRYTGQVSQNGRPDWQDSW